MKYPFRSHRRHDQCNAALRLIRKTKGFLLIPGAWGDPGGTKRRVAARAALGGNARILLVRPTKDEAFQREKQPRRGHICFVFDEGKYSGSADGAALFDADSLSSRLPQLKDALATLERVRTSTGLHLPAWIFLSECTVITEEEARSDVARADAVFAKAAEVRARDAQQFATFFNSGRATKVAPVVISQDIRDFGLDPATLERFALGERLKGEFQATLTQRAVAPQ